MGQMIECWPSTQRADDLDFVEVVGMENDRSIDGKERLPRLHGKPNSQGRVGKPEVYDVITDRIIALLESGMIPWRRPWKTASDVPQNLITRRPYRGINALLLHAMGYASPFWLTFRQAQSLGGKVRRGEKACPVVFWKWLKIEEDGERKSVPMLRHYHVFNAAQVNGLPASAVSVSSSEATAFSPIAEAERIVAGMPDRPEVQYDRDHAAYSPMNDVISIPALPRFQTSEEFYSTLFHEIIHSTGHSRRLNRPGIAASSGFGSDLYCKEELIAEMGASFLCGHCGIEQGTIENSAAYIQGWLKRLKNDRRLVVAASGQAQRACDFVLGRVSHASP
jgi:antirestriction protein ArdC